MKKFLILALLWIEFLIGNIYADSTLVSLTIHPQKELAKLSPMMYGIFFEEINFAGDGGLYAEMIRNRSFEDIRPPEGCKIDGEWAITPGNFKWHIAVNDSFYPWKLELKQNAKAVINLDSTNPLNSAQYYSLRLTINKNNSGYVSLLNNGYYGISIEKDKNYLLSFYTRSIKPVYEKITVSLQDEKGEKYAVGTITGITQNWKKFTVMLKATQTHHNLNLALTFKKPNVIWLDMFSLFPEDTWKNRKNGWRKDIIQMIVDLHPKFVRFPGGCVVEGITLENAFQWKKTLGDIAQRTGHFNLWGYRSTDGIGYHEFLQMSEDLGAEPVFVVNVGMTCQARNSYVKPIDQLQHLINDVLDAIEYANGSDQTYWGSIRAQNEHPKPFNLKYLEIGNENWGNDYDIRYEIFYDAIKNQYPEIKIIRSTHPTDDKNPLYFPNNKGDILDLHYYRSPEWLFKNHNIFDDYPRVGKEIYIGEYACNENVGRGNLMAALADASFLIACERNADLITMVSYAPLFENDDKEGYKWPVNLIHFNNHSVYALPTYYVQQMFSQHKGDVVVASTLMSDSINIPIKYNLIGGKIGLDTYSTYSAFDEVLVTTEYDTLMFENFDDVSLQNPLEVISGNWKIENGMLLQTDTTLFAHAFMGDTSWKNYTLSFKAKRISGSEGFFMTLYRKDENNWLRWNIGGWNNTQHALELKNNGNLSFIAPMVSGKLRTNEWYRVKIKVDNFHIQCFLNDTLIHDITLPVYNTYQRVFAVVTKDTIKNQLIIKMLNPFNSATKIKININNSIKIANEGEEIVITSTHVDDTNQTHNPRNITPQISKINGITNDLNYILKPNSLTFLIVKIY